LQSIDSVPEIEDTMKLSIEAQLVYNFANDTQVIANLEASRTSDQVILSETLDIQPPTKFLSDTTSYGDRSIRASLSGRRDHPVYSRRREQTPTIASAVRSAARVVRPSKRGPTVSAAQPLLPFRQIHAVRAS